MLVSKIIPIFASEKSEIDICQKYLDSLVFSFFFYSKEHEPVHIHVEGNGGMAKFVWNGSEFTLLIKEKIKTNDLKKIKSVIDENADLIIKRWEEHFNS